jgi:hypothetical protein
MPPSSAPLPSLRDAHAPPAANLLAQAGDVKDRETRKQLEATAQQLASPHIANALAPRFG